MEGEPKVKTRTEIRNVFIGRNPDTGRKYFEKRRVPVIKPGELPPGPPSIDDLPPVDQKGRLVKDTQPKLPTLE